MSLTDRIASGIDRVDSYILDKYTRSTPQKTKNLVVNSYTASTVLYASSAFASGSFLFGFAAGVAGVFAYGAHNLSPQKILERSKEYSRTTAHKIVECSLLTYSLGLVTASGAHWLSGDASVHELAYNTQGALGVLAFSNAIYAESAHKKQVRSEEEESSA